MQPPRLALAALLLLGALSPAFAQSTIEASLREMIGKEATRTMPDATPAQIATAVDCGISTLSRLTEAEKQSILDHSDDVMSVLVPLDEKYHGLGAQLDMCDNAALLGVDLTPRPGHDKLDAVIELVVYGRIPDTDPSRRAAAVTCLGAVFKDFSTEHRDLIAADGMMVSPETKAVIEAAHPGLDVAVNACNQFLSASSAAG